MKSTMLLLIIGVTLAACGAGGDGASPAGADAKPILATTELLVGPNRFVFGLVNGKTGAPLPDIPDTVDVQFLKVHDNDTATKVGDAIAVYRAEGLPAGVFVTRTTFDTPGPWGVLLTVRPTRGEPYTVRLGFDVLADSPAPRLGEPAPPSRNLTGRDVRLSAIDSARPHDAMHDIAIADAVRSGKPTLILFATPGYCETATCGPDLEVAQALQKKHGGRASFIHIETPSHPAAPQAQKPTVEQWGLRSEPWIFLVDKQGKVAERFEGGLTLAEVEPAFEKLLR